MHGQVLISSRAFRAYLMGGLGNYTDRWFELSRENMARIPLTCLHVQFTENDKELCF